MLETFYDEAELLSQIMKIKKNTYKKEKLC